MQDFIIGHLWIIIPLAMFFWMEYIPFTKTLWEKVGLKIKGLGEWFISEYENKLYQDKKDWAESTTKKIQLKNFFARVIFFAFATLVVIFLEIFWELGFKKTNEKFQKSKIALWFEEKVDNMDRYTVLLIFGAPFIIMEILGVLAAFYLVSGNWEIFVVLYTIKFLLFIPIKLILDIGKEKLMSIPWFKRRYDSIINVLEWFKKSQTYVRVHNFMENIGSYVRGFKNLFTNSVINMDKAFKGEDLLSDECEAIRLEIKNMKKPTKADFKKFFDCINGHINNSKTK